MKVFVPAILCVPLVLTTDESTANDMLPLAPPPLNPSPALTWLISPTSLNVITPVPLS